MELWQQFKPGDKLLRIHSNFYPVSKNKIYTFVKYFYETKTTLILAEFSLNTFDSDRFVKVDLDVFNQLGD